MRDHAYREAQIPRRPLDRKEKRIMMEDGLNAGAF
jgi:hypothetical protein